jgi:hypothetical protein
MAMFAEAMKNESRKTFTENGAKAYNSTSDACLDLFGTIGALRNRPIAEVESLFAEAFKENPLMATKILFYARDIREGCGERETFRNLIKYLAKYHKEAIIPNLDLIGVYGRYDDLYALIDTPVEDEMWAAMKKQFEEDRDNYAKGNAISLLAKWIKTPDASSKATRELGIKTALQLGYKVYDFKRILRNLRKHIDIVEAHMSAGEWDKITYSEVPSRAMLIYRNAFMRHDKDRFIDFTEKAVNGEEKINSSTLYPYDIVEKVFRGESDDTLEAQWRQLPNYVEDGTNAIVMADVSGSMYGRPMATSVGLAMYFAERNVGAYHNLFMTFSSEPTVVTLKGETLEQKVRFLSNADWGMSTNLEKAFMKVLSIAVENHIPQSEMVKSIIVISDMEIDAGCRSDWSFYDDMKKQFAEAGYEIPNVVFWNCNSRHNVFHADSTRQGVQLCSGQSTTTFKQLMSCIGMTPVEMMIKVIESERYSAITIA